MNIEEIALRLIESDCNVDIYFGILDKLEKHTTKIQELEKEKAHIEIAYEEDYKEQQQEIERLNNIINTILDFNFFKEECPLNFGYTEKCDEEKAQDVFYEDDYCEKTCNDNYKKCWLKYFKRLQELKGSDKE